LKEKNLQVSAEDEAEEQGAGNQQS